MRGVSGKLIERGIHRQPQAAAVAFVQVDLRPRVVIERAAHVDQPDVDPRRNALRSCQRHEQHRVLVAVAHLRPQHFEGRRQAHGGLLLHQLIDLAHQAFRAGAHAGHTTHHALGRGTNFGGVAFDERFGRQVTLQIGIGGGRRETARVHQLDHVAGHRLARALQVWAGEVRVLDPHPQASHVARFGDPHARRDDRHYRRGGQHVFLHAL